MACPNCSGLENLYGFHLERNAYYMTQVNEIKNKKKRDEHIRLAGIPPLKTLLLLSVGPIAASLRERVFKKKILTRSLIYDIIK